jgi:hypothetical protein
MTLLEIAMFLHDNNKSNLARELLKTFELHAFTIEQMDEIIVIYDKLHFYQEVIDLAIRELEIATEQEEYFIKVNLTRVYNLLNEPHKSLELSNWVLNKTPNNEDVLIEKSISLSLLNNRDEANKLLLELEQKSNNSAIRNAVKHNLTAYYLSRHEFNKGLSCIWDNSKPKETNKYNFDYWDKTPIQDAVLLIESYGGYGDEIINIRFLENIKALGMIPVWKTHRKDIRDIIIRMGYQAIEHVTELDSTKYTVWCVSMRLPYLLNLDEHEIDKGPYLTATPESIEKFKQYRGCVGIKYYGEIGYEHNLHRTLDLDELVSNISEQAVLVSLHQEPIHSNIRPIIDLSAKLKTFDDTLGLIYNLDYVVSSCTSVPHAAGALGKETYIFTPIFEYYLWSSTTDTSTIWYKNTTLLRQIKWKSWAEPMNQLKSKLEIRQVYGNSTISLPNNNNLL